MKKITLLMFALLVSTITFAQTPIITMISDGDCSGGNPKVVELYADGTVDFSEYSLESQTNANTSWGSTLNLAGLGTVTDDFVYIYKDDPSFATEYPGATNVLATTSNAVNFNGDDRIRLVQDSDMSVVDQYGEDAQDGTGEAWEYADGYAKRNNGTSANGVFTAANWTFNNGALNGEGLCQGGTTSFEDIIGIGSFTPGNGTLTPGIVITSPADNSILSPSTTNVSVSINIVDFTISSSTTANDGDGYVQYSTNGGTTYTDKFDENDIALSNLSTGTHTVEVRLVDNSGNVLNPAVEDMVTFTIPTVTQVADITALRADVAANGIGSFYEITGESILTHTDSYNNRKWFQDETISGIMIFDADAVIANDAYTVGDHVTGLVGYTEEFNGVLQFIPIEDAGVVASNAVAAPQVVSINDFNTNWEVYESELIAFENVSIQDVEDGTGLFETGTNYTVTDGTEDVIMRTEFYNADYIGEAIPQNVLASLVGVAAEYNGTSQIFVRNAADIDATLATERIAQDTFSVYPNPASNGFINISTVSTETASVAIFNILGKQVLSKELNNQAINISGLQSGVYLIKVTQKGKSTTKKLVIK